MPKNQEPCVKEIIMGKKYIVQPGASYAAEGRVYGPGDELDGDIFKNPEVLKFAVGGKIPKLKEAPATPSGGSDTTEAEIVKGLKKSLKTAKKDAKDAAEFLEKAKGDTETAATLAESAAESEKAAAEEALAAAMQKQADAEASKEKFDGIVKSIQEELEKHNASGGDGE
jgi:hypothetical protein